MASNTKTPVMVLQELSVKSCKSAPEYSVIYAKQGTHQNEFHIQVVVDKISAIGVGRSKQVAKHDAAQKALEQLELLGVYKSGHTVIKAPGVENTTSPTRLGINSIGVLSELCVENKIPLPSFIPISEVGPPHCKEFTYQCRIASILTRATAGTKKQAKQMAAKDMLERIIQALPDIVAEFGDMSTDLALVENDQVVVDTYNSLFVKARPNLSLRVKDCHANILDSVIKKEIDMNEIYKFFTQAPTMECLVALAEKMELQVAIDIVEEEPFCIVALKLNTETPFVCLSLGKTFESARESVIKKGFEYLKVFLKPLEEVNN